MMKQKIHLAEAGTFPPEGKSVFNVQNGVAWKESSAASPAAAKSSATVIEFLLLQ